MRFIVYTMGKVGSRGIDMALEEACVPVDHIHSLSKDDLRALAERNLRRGQLPPGHVAKSMYLLQRRFRNPFYISCVRDPLTRNLSAFFQNLPDYVANPDHADPADVLATFKVRYRQDAPLTWFDREWRDQLGIDVFKTSFDKEARMARGPNWLVFRLDCPDEKKSEILSDLTGKTIRVTRRNGGETKPFAQLYEAVKELARRDGDLMLELYDSRFARHFWTDEERASMIRQWA